MHSILFIAFNKVMHQGGFTLKVMASFLGDLRYFQSYAPLPLKEHPSLGFSTMGLRASVPR